MIGFQVYLWDASAAGFTQFGNRGLMVEGLNGTNPLSATLGEGANATLDRANSLARQSYGDGQLDPGAIVHSLAQLSAVLNASSMNLGALVAAHMTMDDTRRTLSKVYRRATARDLFGTFDTVSVLDHRPGQY